MRGRISSHKELDDAIEEAVEVFRCKIPFRFENFNFGNLKLEFEYNREKLSREKRNRKVDLLYVLLEYVMDSLPPLLEKIIDLRLKLEEKYDEQIEITVYSRGTFTSLYFRDIENQNLFISPLSAFLRKEEDEIFKLIKSEGPIVICDLDIQEKILEWLGNKEIVSIKVNKLKDALLEYSYQIPAEDKLFRVGRPKAELTRRIGEENIKSFYKVLLGFLNFVKKREEYRCKANDISVLIKEAGNSYFRELTEKMKKSKDDIELFESSLWKSAIEDPFFRISVCLERNMDLKAEFLRFKWEPNKFAKNILSELLCVSVSKIEKILYRKKR